MTKESLLNQLWLANENIHTAINTIDHYKKICRELESKLYDVMPEDWSPNDDIPVIYY